MKLHGEYEVAYSTDFDRGYGVESSADEVVCSFEEGEFVGAMAYGLHFVNEEDCEWEVELEPSVAHELVCQGILAKGVKL